MSFRTGSEEHPAAAAVPARVTAFRKFRRENSLIKGPLRMIIRKLTPMSSSFFQGIFGPEFSFDFGPKKMRR
jgi:hypothetical protein